MIKGCSRKVIVIKNPGSDLFEEAYFIVSPKVSERKHGDFLHEANRIIALKSGSEPCVKKGVRLLWPLLVGFATGACSALVISYFVF